MACAALKRPHNFDLLGSPQRISGSPKRRRCGAVATSMSPSTSTSPFLEATPILSRDELASNVHDEWKRIQKRRRLGLQQSSNINQCSQPLQHMLKSFQTHSSPHNVWTSRGVESFSPPPGSMSPTGSMSPPHGKDQTAFSVKQVVSLCERLWKEREEKLREQYDQVLHEKLSEQYDSFLKFTQDQIMRKYQGSSCSYVS